MSLSLLYFTRLNTSVSLHANGWIILSSWMHFLNSLLDYDHKEKSYSWLHLTGVLSYSFILQVTLKQHLHFWVVKWAALADLALQTSLVPTMSLSNLASPNSRQTGHIHTNGTGFLPNCTLFFHTTTAHFQEWPNGLCYSTLQRQI